MKKIIFVLIVFCSMVLIGCSNMGNEVKPLLNQGEEINTVQKKVEGEKEKYLIINKENLDEVASMKGTISGSTYHEFFINDGDLIYLDLNGDGVIEKIEAINDEAYKGVQNENKYKKLKINDKDYNISSYWCGFNFVDLNKNDNYIEILNMRMGTANDYYPDSIYRYDGKDVKLVFENYANVYSDGNGKLYNINIILDNLTPCLSHGHYEINNAGVNWVDSGTEDLSSIIFSNTGRYSCMIPSDKLSEYNDGNYHQPQEVKKGDFRIIGELTDELKEFPYHGGYIVEYKNGEKAYLLSLYDFSG